MPVLQKGILRNVFFVWVKHSGLIGAFPKVSRHAADVKNLLIKCKCQSAATGHKQRNKEVFAWKDIHGLVHIKISASDFMRDLKGKSRLESDAA